MCLDVRCECEIGRAQNAGGGRNGKRAEYYIEKREIEAGYLLHSPPK